MTLHDIVGNVPPTDTVRTALTSPYYLSGGLCHAGKSAWGIELSKAVLEQECPDLLKDGYVEAGILTNLPYANNRSGANREQPLRLCDEGPAPHLRMPYTAHENGPLSEYFTALHHR